jgi:hypothetical protein
MGTGHSADTPIRVAPFGISSVVSLVDDLLLERLRGYYCKKYSLPFKRIARYEEDGRAKRTEAYLNMMDDVVQIRFKEIQEQAFGQDSEKDKFFRMLPDDHELKIGYLSLLSMAHGDERDALDRRLTKGMRPGSIDVNIMVKLDKVNYAGKDVLSEEYSDAKAALRGYAKSKVSSGIVFSAGINKPLFGYMSEFKDFYRDKVGFIKKKIILKVSDFRSAMIQGKFLSRKGLEVHEFRVESGLNCGGHAFASEGELLPMILKEFSDKRHQLKDQFSPMVKKYYEDSAMDLAFEESVSEVLLTVQGGIGNHGEDSRLRRDYNVDRTGWASPFLLVPEAACVDEPTLKLLASAGEDDLYLSGASPLGVPFNNVKKSGSSLWTEAQFEKGSPGSACPKGFLISNTEFSERPICTASKEYQAEKLDEINAMELSADQKQEEIGRVLEKACICDHLGNGALIALGLARETNAPQSVCPGPNIAWFSRKYSLEEMIDHVYGRCASLVPSRRPHMYAKEVSMYLDWVRGLLKDGADDRAVSRRVKKILVNLRAGVDYCSGIAMGEIVGDENLKSLHSACEKALALIGEMELSLA